MHRLNSGSREVKMSNQEILPDSFYETLNWSNLKRLNGFVAEYSAALGLSRIKKRSGRPATIKENVSQICHSRVEICRFVRPERGKVTLNHCRNLIRYMVENPVAGFVVSHVEIEKAVRAGSNRQSAKMAARHALKSGVSSCTKSHNDKSARPRKSEKNKFYDSWEWNRLRYETLKRFGRKCLCCGASPETGATIQVDHIKPLHTHWHLRNDPENLQVLCASCNKGKAAVYADDFRPSEPAPNNDEESARLDLIRDQLAIH